MAILSYKDIPISKKYYSDIALFYLSDDQILELFYSLFITWYPREMTLSTVQITQAFQNSSHSNIIYLLPERAASDFDCFCDLSFLDW